jgi:hypothetical protein
MAVFVCKAAGKTQLNSPTSRSSDVPPSHAFYGSIERSADAPPWASYGPPTTGIGGGPAGPAMNVARG